MFLRGPHKCDQSASACDFQVAITPREFNIGRRLQRGRGRGTLKKFRCSPHSATAHHRATTEKGPAACLLRCIRVHDVRHALRFRIIFVILKLPALHHRAAVRNLPRGRGCFPRQSRAPPNRSSLRRSPPWQLPLMPAPPRRAMDSPPEMSLDLEWPGRSARRLACVAGRVALAQRTSPRG